MTRDVPAGFLPDRAVFIGKPCEGCGVAVEPPGSQPDHRGQVIYDHSPLGETLLQALGVGEGNWHLECAFGTSARIEAAEPRYCPDCGEASQFHPTDEDDGVRVCVRCIDVRPMEDEPLGGEP